ncbi:hypothetical protein [Marinospirillum alkaliphilum]|uniref:Uncharacterized protein n=1 Tax=Marinospirillum alkaliphilum DSM 21637 TaxID=1122209 RepID=A0A1K1VUU9_9GAMM|nr:hypothetical protein [Marinospirillum alkaliphilum]SFX28910.1 hypothetical protein SAMN02745752_01080 [Marinospirillum alkaliphilum DSM 21637]
MRKNPIKSNPSDEKGKAKPAADKAKPQQQSGKDDTVLSDVNNSARKEKK